MISTGKDLVENPVVDTVVEVRQPIGNSGTDIQ